MPIPGTWFWKKCIFEYVGHAQHRAFHNIYVFCQRFLIFKQQSFQQYISYSLAQASSLLPSLSICVIASITPPHTTTVATATTINPKRKNMDDMDDVEFSPNLHNLAEQTSLQWIFVGGKVWMRLYSSRRGVFTKLKLCVVVVL